MMYLLKIGLKNILFLSFAFSLFGQNADSLDVRPQISSLAKQIAETGMYTGGSITVSKDGFSPGPSKADYAFHEIKKIATEDELIRLCNHKNPVVRSYAFIALAEQKSNKTFEILLSHLTDTEYVISHLGCIRDEQKVGDFFIEVVTAQYPNPTGYKLSQKEKIYLDSALIFNPLIRLDSKLSIFKRNKSKEEYYKLLKQYYEGEKKWIYLVQIAKYQKNEDINLILSLLNDNDLKEQKLGLTAVQFFPHIDFFPSIEKIYQRQIQKINQNSGPFISTLYLALVQYKSEYSKKLIIDALRSLDKRVQKYHMSAIQEALSRYPSPIYLSVLEEIKSIKSK